LSNLIKSQSVISVDQLKKLQTLYKYEASIEEQHELAEEAGPDESTISLRDQILSDAEQFAEERLHEAAEQSERMLTDAQAQIDVWWLEKRSEDQTAFEAAQHNGYAQGHSEGIAVAEAEVRQQWEQRLSEASAVLSEAYIMKEQIIQEAEPFLVELSCMIAEKVIDRQLTLNPDIVVELIRKSLSRRREQGVITLCVSPGQLAFVQAAREELNMAIDSQAELQILPDSTVKDSGCVIRSAYGSIDARIDTQLSEIKRELISLSHRSNEERGLQHEHD